MAGADKGGAKSGALGKPDDCFEPRLGEIVAAWPNLSEGLRTILVAKVRQAIANGSVRPPEQP
jgi:hypothetical protein